MKEFLRNAKLPSQAAQSANLMARIGDWETQEGNGLVNAKTQALVPDLMLDVWVRGVA